MFHNTLMKGNAKCVFILNNQVFKPGCDAQQMNSSEYPMSGRVQFHFCGVAGIGFVLATGPDTKTTISADSRAISIP